MPPETKHRKLGLISQLTGQTVGFHSHSNEGQPGFIWPLPDWMREIWLSLPPTSNIKIIPNHGQRHHLEKHLTKHLCSSWHGQVGTHHPIRNEGEIASLDIRERCSHEDDSRPEV